MNSPEVRSRYHINVKAPMQVTSTGKPHKEEMEVTLLKERLRESELKLGRSEQEIIDLELRLREIKNKMQADFNEKYDAQIKVLAAKDEVIRDQKRRLDECLANHCDKRETIVEEVLDLFTEDFDLPPPWVEHSESAGHFLPPGGKGPPSGPLSTQEREVYKEDDMNKVWEAAMIHISGLKGCVAWARCKETGTAQFYGTNCFGNTRSLEGSTAGWTTYTNGTIEDILGPPQQEAAPAPPEPEAPVAEPMKPRAEVYADLMNAFDLVDEDEAELAPRLDLRKQIDTFIPAMPAVQKLSDTVRNMDAMIVEREDYEEVVKAWLESENIPE